MDPAPPRYPHWRTALVLGFALLLGVLESLPMLVGGESAQVRWEQDGRWTKLALLGFQVLRYLAARAIIWGGWLLLGWLLLSLFKKLQPSMRRAGLWCLGLLLPAVIAHLVIVMVVFTLLPVTSGGFFPLGYERFTRMALYNLGASGLGSGMLAMAITLILWSNARGKQQEQQVVAMQVLAQEAHLRALRMQLEPHFLFNVLNGVVSLVRAGEKQVSAEMLTKLSGLLRESFRDDAPSFPTLEEELRFLQDYLDLERLRFGERLLVELDVSVEARRVKVPARLFLPAIENAIKHGLGAREGAFRLRVEGRVDGGYLEVCVLDDGPGLGANPVLGTGWRNTETRIESVYNGRASWTKGQSSWGGTQVSFRLPVEHGAGQAGALA